MATYIDVAALVGIKIYSTGTLTAAQSVIVPTGNYYALVTYINSAQMLDGNTNRMPAPMIVGNSESIAISAAGQFAIGGVNIGYASGSTAHFVIYANNQ